MPWNITSPNQARFVIRFLSSLGTPSSASVTLTYLINNAANSSSVDLTLSGGFWTAIWSSAGVDVPSDVPFTIFNSLSSSPAQVGTLRIIDP